MSFSVSKSIVRSYLALFSFVIVSGLLLFLTDKLEFHIVSMVVLTFGALYVVKWDLSHPYSWYSCIFLLYSLGYPVVYINSMTYDVHTYTRSLMVSQWLALVTFLLVVSPKKIDYSALRTKPMRVVSNKVIMLFMSIILLITIIEVSTGGYTHKREIYATGSLVVSMGFRLALIFIIFYGYNLLGNVLSTGRIDRIMTIYSFLLIALLVGFSGERDLILRLIIVFFMIYYVFVAGKRINRETWLIGILGILSLPLLKRFKYFGLTGEVASTQGSLFLDLITSDFVSASKNMQILLLDESSRGRFGGFTWVSAVMRSLNLDILLPLDFISSTRWYNDTYFAANRAGQGFTLVGDGYINFGYFGIVLLFVFVGFLVRKIYQRSGKGVLQFLFYVISIPTFMYSTRADLANIISPLIKQNMVSLLVLQLMLLLPTKQSKKG